MSGAVAGRVSIAAVVCAAVAGCVAGPNAHGLPSRVDPAAPDAYGFGDTHHDGVCTRVSQPLEFTTSGNARPSPNTRAWAVTVTFTNTTSVEFPAGALGVVGFNGNRPAQPVIDHTHGYGTSGQREMGLLPPASSVDVRYAFTSGEGQRRVVVVGAQESATVTFTEP